MDDRQDYGEPRIIAFGQIVDRLFTCTYTMHSEVYRIISLRKTSRQESNVNGYSESNRKAADRARAAIGWAVQDAKTDDDIARELARNLDVTPILSDAETAAGITRLIRHRLGISQAVFAACYHVPIGTLRDWEQNRKRSDAPALAYLRVTAHEPDIVARALAAAQELCPSILAVKLRTQRTQSPRSGQPPLIPAHS